MSKLTAGSNSFATSTRSSVALRSRRILSTKATACPQMSVRLPSYRECASSDLDAEHTLQDHDDGEEPEESAEEQQPKLAPERGLDLAWQKLAVHVPHLNAIDRHHQPRHEGAEEDQDERLSQIDGDAAPDHEDNQRRIIDLADVPLGPAANARVARPEDVGDGPGQKVYDAVLRAVEDPEPGQQRDVPEEGPGRALEPAESGGNTLGLADGDRHPPDYRPWRDELHGQQRGEAHSEKAADRPDPALVEADIPPPLAELANVLRRRVEDLACGRQLHLASADDARDETDRGGHAHALVPDPVRYRAVAQPACAGVGGEPCEDEPVRPLGHQAHQITGLRVADEVRAAAEESADHGQPRIEAGEDEAEEQQGGHDPDDHEPFGVFERSLDLFPKQQQGQRGEERRITPELDQCRLLGTGDAADLRGGDCRRGGGRPPGPAQLDESEDRPEPAPEHRPPLGAHEAAHDRFAGVERVARSFFVEDPLEQDRSCSNPQQRRRELGCDSWPDEPLAAANRDAEDDRPRSSHAERVLEVVGRWGVEFRHFPRW